MTLSDEKVLTHSLSLYLSLFLPDYIAFFFKLCRFFTRIILPNDRSIGRETILKSYLIFLNYIKISKAKHFSIRHVPSPFFFFFFFFFFFVTFYLLLHFKMTKDTVCVPCDGLVSKAKSFSFCRVSSLLVPFSLFF